MDVQVESTEDGALVIVSGDVDIETADELRRAGEELAGAEQGSTLRIDVSQVTFIDSTGLGALIAINNKASAAGQAVVLVRPRSQLQRLLEITGLTDAFRVE